MDPANLREVIVRRSKIFDSLRHDQKWHPINEKPQSGNSATHRKWIEGQQQWLASANLAQTRTNIARVQENMCYPVSAKDDVEESEDEQYYMFSL